ncbi:hypothetical protein EDB92DRAFT_1528236 [Lactarius akahatsu]|uniref:BTB domain-containing protein n=1 Tax=Lactarius akahatsu TaxID=416441 RepID=A0AAD4QAP6_9AGAM|nr:hypothetical protein EDB92DRAFT_1528236 [Lactarius akahatsu]
MLCSVYVENTLFRVHRYFFTRDSSWFRDRLPYPAPPGETTKGSSDNLPLVLDDITKTEFEQFLWVFYNPKYSLYDASIDEWTSILKLAHAWNFIEVKELAIRGLEGLQVPALQKVVLYQKYDVNRNRLQTAYTALTVRDEPITIEEGRELGLETSLQLARAREVARAPVFSGKGVGNPRSPVNLAGVELDAIINDIFELTSGSEHTTQTPTGRANARDTSQTGTAQTNSGSSASNTSQGRLTVCVPSIEHVLNR